MAHYFRITGFCTSSNGLAIVRQMALYSSYLLEHKNSWHVLHDVNIMCKHEKDFETIKSIYFVSTYTAVNSRLYITSAIVT